MQPLHFESADAFRRWLERHHASEKEAMVRMRKAGAASPGITYAEALDQALCFGWIDGVRFPGGESWFVTRFSPRKPRSTWSNLNVRHFERLEKLGLVASAGRAAFARRDPNRTGIYSFELRPKAMPETYARAFRRHRAAWAFFSDQPPGYRRVAAHWVTSAKREETRRRRLERLIADSEKGRRLGLLSGKPAK